MPPEAVVLTAPVRLPNFIALSIFSPFKSANKNPALNESPAPIVSTTDSFKADLNYYFYPFLHK